MKIKSKLPSVKCKVFEDNNGAIKWAKAPKLLPGTKYIALKYQQFGENVRKGLIKINPIDTLEQVADAFKKYLPFPIFNYLRAKNYGLEQTVLDIDKWGNVRIRRFIKL